MAKKQKKELPPEERLAAARVPEEEWPYELPEDWAWVYIKAGFEVTSSKRVHKEDWLSDGIPFYRTRELVKLSDDGYVENELFISEQLYNEFKESYGVPQEGDILISGVGTIGVPYIVDSSQKFYFKDGNVIWFKNLGLFLPKYIFYLYKSQFMYNQLHAMSSGTTVDTYTIVNAKKTKVPLPPLEIQQQIVTNIERLFTKLDQAREKAQQTLATAEPRKAAILHQAFTGKLTEKWRTENGVVLDEWEEKKFGELVADARLGLVRSKKEQGNNKQYKYLKMNNITSDGRVDLSDIVFVDADENEADWFELRHGDFLFNTRNSYELVGKNAVWDLNCSNQVLFNNNLMRVRFKQGINPFLVRFYLNSNEGKRKLDSCKKKYYKYRSYLC